MTDQKKSSSLDSLKLIGTGRAFRAELCDMIATTQIFGDFEWHDIEVLADYMQAYEASDGTTLFHEGEAGNYLCLIIKGKVSIYKEDQHEKEKIVSTISAGKTLGEMAIIDGEPRSATAVVAGPATLGILTKSNFLRIVSEKPALAARILMKVSRLLSQRLRQTSGLLVDYLED